MEITYFGNLCFRLKGKKSSVITDPFTEDKQIQKLLKTDTSAVTLSRQHPENKMPETSSLIIIGPGEYETKGVKILGLNTSKTDDPKAVKNITYRIEIDRVSAVHTGAMGRKFTDAELDFIDYADILIASVGEESNMTPQIIIDTATQLEAKIIIPMISAHTSGEKKDIMQQKPVTDFLREIGKTGVVSQPKFVISKDKLPAEVSVVVLEG